jgi:hypothetical protein
MCRPPGFRDANCTLGTRRRRSGVPRPARSRGPSRAAAPPENRRREGDCSVGVPGPPRDPSEDDRVQRTRAVGSGSAEHVGGTAGAQPVCPRNRTRQAVGRILFLWATSCLLRCKKKIGDGASLCTGKRPR